MGGFVSRIRRELPGGFKESHRNVVEEERGVVNGEEIGETGEGQESGG